MEVPRKASQLKEYLKSLEHLCKDLSTDRYVYPAM